MNNVILKTNGLCKSFSHGGNQQHVLKNMDIEIYDGDFTVIMGTSGGGKSTLLYALSGMDTPTLGDVMFGDVNLAKLSQDKLAVFRRDNAGFVFQQIHLVDSMSVLDNVLSSGLLPKGVDKKAMVEKAKALLVSVGIDESMFKKFPTQLSGGECQRVGIVRALINNPQILFADEPTGSLNSSTSTAVLDILTKVNESGQSIVMVTHDLKTSLRGNRILYLRDGAIVGELKMDKFNSANIEKRKNEVEAFLNDMRW